jgi:thiol-disulfide isomerase/thioredoxin
MKKIVLLSTLFAFLFVTSCKDDKKETPSTVTPIEVTQQQNAIFFDISATWCPPCGTYGIPAFAAAIETSPEKTVAINTHVSSSDLGTATGQDLADFYQATGIPTLAVGNEKTGAFTDINYTKGVMLGFANKIWAKTSLANTLIETKIEGEDIKVTTNSKFFSDAETDGKYRMSVWMLEDGVMNKQSHSTGGVKVIEHNHVLRASLTPTFGKELSTEAILKDKMFTNDFTVNIAGKDMTKLTLVAVIWKETSKDGNPFYTFINADKLHLK